MTEKDMTAAELDKLENSLRRRADGESYPFLRVVADGLASLRKQLDEAREERDAQARAAAIEEAAALADISVSALEAARRIRALASRPVSEREGADTAPAPAKHDWECASNMAEHLPCTCAAPAPAISVTPSSGCVFHDIGAPCQKPTCEVCGPAPAISGGEIVRGCRHEPCLFLRGVPCNCVLAAADRSAS